MKIRIGKRDDVEAISKIGAEAFETAFKNERNAGELVPYVKTAFSTINISKEFEAPGNVFILAEMKDEAVGFARLWEEVHNQFNEKRNIKMERLYLLPAFIGKGVGKLLMEASIDYSKAHQYEIIWLQVFEPNMDAVQFYKKSGFKLFGYAPGKFDSDPGRDLCLYRELT